MCSAITLDKVDLVCAETIKNKPTGNHSGFITYSNKIYFSGIWLYNSGYIITQWIVLVERKFCLMVQNIRNEKKILKVGKIGAKYDILTVHNKQVAQIYNKTKRIPEMTPWKREVESRRLKVAKIRIKK